MGILDNLSGKPGIEEYFKEGENVLAKCQNTETNTTFYATDRRVIKAVGNHFTHLDYSDIASLSVRKERLKYLMIGIGCALVGLLIAAMMGTGFVYTIRWIPFFFFFGGILGIVLAIFGIKYCQFESLKLNRVERGQWKISNIERESVKGFIKIVEEYLEIGVTTTDRTQSVKNMK